MVNYWVVEEEKVGGIGEKIKVKHIQYLSKIYYITIIFFWSLKYWKWETWDGMWNLWSATFLNMKW